MQKTAQNKNYTKRRNYFIKKDFQSLFALRFIGLIAIQAFLIAVLLMLVARGTLTTSYRGTQLQIQKTSMFFSGSFLIIALVTAAAIGISGIVIFIYLSHRLAGPLYKFERTINDIGNGDVSFRVKLRKTDQFKDMQQPLNKLLNNTDQKISQLKKDIDNGYTIAKKPDIKKEDLAKIVKVFNNLRDTIGFFRTSK